MVTRRSMAILALFLGSLATFTLVDFLRGQQPQAEAKVRIGAWNIEWLGYPDRRKGPEQSPEHIGAYLLEHKVDVVSIEEVSAGEGTEAEPRNKILTETMAWLKQKTGQEWRYLLFPKLPGGEADFVKHQWTGVLWNTSRVKLVGDPFKIPVRRSEANKEIWSRWPHAVKFSTGEGKTDFVLIPIHMKSNRGGEGVTSEQRSEEAKALVRAFATVQNQFTDDDIIPLGDFNLKSTKEKAHARFVGAGLRDLNEDDATTWIADATYPAAPFDRIFVPDDQPEFKSSVQTVAKSAAFLRDSRWPGTIEEKFRHYLSDHWMVVAEVPVMADDD